MGVVDLSQPAYHSEAKCAGELGPLHSTPVGDLSRDLTRLESSCVFYTANANRFDIFLIATSREGLDRLYR